MFLKSSKNRKVFIEVLYLFCMEPERKYYKKQKNEWPVGDNILLVNLVRVDGDLEYVVSAREDSRENIEYDLGIVYAVENPDGSDYGEKFIDHEIKEGPATDTRTLEGIAKYIAWEMGQQESDVPSFKILNTDPTDEIYFERFGTGPKRERHSTYWRPLTIDEMRSLHRLLDQYGSDEN